LKRSSGISYATKSEAARFAVADNSLVISTFVLPEGAASKALRRMGLDLTILASEATIAELHRTLLRPKFDKWVSYELRMELFARYLNSVNSRITHDPSDGMP
jgi:predicted nucleic acid-binding protein